MRPIRAILLAAALAGCAYPHSPAQLSPVTAPAPATALSGGSTVTATPPATPVSASAPVIILVSIDGFRHDYLTRGVTPTLSRLAAGGVSAPMYPSFPSKTFPNHWTIVTGLVPDRTGIVGNKMEDVARPGETFRVWTDDPFWWNAAEPIWVTAERTGVRTATEFWPGASIAWGSTAKKDHHDIIAGGTRPRDWHDYQPNITEDQRVDAVIDWLRRPAETRPRFITLYFDTVDNAGHDFGPDSPQVNAAAAVVDRSIGRLVDGLATLGQKANLVIISDHGMAATSSDRIVALDRIAAPGDFRVIETGPYASIVPTPGHEAALDAALIKPHEHMICWRKSQIPARLQYGRNPRVSPYICLADIGWQVLATTATTKYSGGEHGYDNEAPEMRAIFIGNGPAFRAGKTLRPFPNVDIAPLLRDLIGLPAGKDLDGTDAPFRGVMTR